MKIVTAAFLMNKTTNTARCTLSPSLRQETTPSKSAKETNVIFRRAAGVPSSITSFRWWLARRQKKDSFLRKLSMTMKGKCGVARSMCGLTRRTLPTFMRRESTKYG